MEPDILRENDSYVTELRSAIRHGSGLLSEVPGLLKAILRDGRWRERTIIKTGKPANFARFEDFVTTPPLEGLGADMPLIERIVADDPETVELLNEARLTDGPHNPSGRNQHNNPDGSHGNTKRTSNTVNDAGYAIRRLRKQRPDLHARVIAKELSPHAAAVEAGFRRRKITIPVEPPEAMARAIDRHLPGDGLRLLIESLMSLQAEREGEGPKGGQG